jgi:GDP-L-fucose synthase
MMNTHEAIYVAGHTGLVGSAICRELWKQGYDNIRTASHKEVDLTKREQVHWWLSVTRPKFVFLCAARVGGILANSTKPVNFLLDNLTIQNNVIELSAYYGVEKLLFLGSACAYPKHATNPLKPEQLMTGALEPSNAPYAIAKIAGHMLCQAYREQFGKNFISCIPTNLYGPGDHYDLHDSHVLPGMIARIHGAQERGERTVTLWGTGEPVREFLFSEDMARACIRLMNDYSGATPVNVGSGYVLSLKQLARLVADALKYRGEIHWDATKPNGTPERWLDNHYLWSIRWKPEVGIEAGIKIAVEDFLCR